MGNDGSTKATGRQNLGYLLGCLIGAVITGYFGIGMLLIPGLACIAVYVTARIMGRRSAAFLPAIALESGHVAWMAVGGIVTHQFSAILIDVLVLGALLAWLIVRPGRVSAMVLLVVNTVWTVVNIYRLGSAAQEMTKALLLHLTLQLAILTALRYGLRKQRKEEWRLRADPVD